MSKLKLVHSSGNSMSLEAPATNPASDLALKLPATVGTAGQVLMNSSTAGTLEFGAVDNTAKAWANIDGTGTPSIRDSYNCSSITDHGVGHFTVSFTTNMTDDDYAWVASGQNYDSGSADQTDSYVGVSAVYNAWAIGSIKFKVLRWNWSTYEFIDSPNVGIAVFR